MTSEEEVERQIRRALVLRAARVHLGTEEGWIKPVTPRPTIQSVPPASPRRQWLQRPWQWAGVPAMAALVAAIVMLGSGHVASSPPVGVQSATVSTGVVVRGTDTPPARRAAGGVVLAGQDRGQQPAAGNRAPTEITRTCVLGFAPAMVHGLRSPNCID